VFVVAECEPDRSLVLSWRLADGPALCNVAVTNSCNATCDFCNFANGKVERKDLRWIDADQFDSALQILHDRGIRDVSFFGGEPLLHLRLPEMIAMSVAKVWVRLLSPTAGYSLQSLMSLLRRTENSVCLDRCSADVRP
jgi:molybdenum cofactor biosynthesis enzyme MoaA